LERVEFGYRYNLLVHLDGYTKSGLDTQFTGERAAWVTGLRQNILYPDRFAGSPYFSRQAIIYFELGFSSGLFEDRCCFFFWQVPDLQANQ
jgi:hypothetical protein